MKKLLFIILFSFVGYAQTDYSSVKKQLQEIVKEDFFNSAGISISIFDLTENQSIFEFDSQKLLRPASNMKILTSSAGLYFLRGDYKFSTKLCFSGAVLNNILYGDLYVKGGLDPDFTSKDLDSLVSALKSLQIKEISGNVFLDLSIKDSLFWGNGWMWDDDPSTDAPYLSALNINDNAVKVFIKPGKLLEKAEIRTEPVTDFVSIVNRTLTARELNEPLVVSREWLYRSNEIIASGTVSPSDSETVVILNVYNPENYFVTLFREKLNELGISFNADIKNAKTPENAIQIGSIERPFDSVLVNLNKTSDNLSAEMTLFALGEKFLGSPATAKKGLRLIDSLVILSGKNPMDYVYVDGSGVSHYNLVSSGLINSILQFIYSLNDSTYQKLYESFPVAGIDGTLKTRMRGTSAEGNVHAKTGTLSGVSCLSGYLNTGSGNLLSFSIMVQNYRGSSATARRYQDRICAILTSFGDLNLQSDLK